MSDSQTHKSKRPIRWLGLLAVAGLTAALLSVQPGAAGAAAAPDPGSPPVDLAVTSYASDYSVSLTEAQRRLDRIQPLQEILASIRSLESARLAGWGIDHTASFGGWVWLTGDDPPGAAAAAVADAHADVRIRTGADHSHAELLTAQQGLFRNGAVSRVNDGPASGVAAMVAFTGIDMAANAVRIGIDPALVAVVPGGLTDTGPVAVTDEAFRAKAAEVTEQLRGHINVNYVVEDGRGLSVSATFKGGERMDVEFDGARADCTSGFAAKQRGTSVYGIITAAHCKGTSAMRFKSISMHNVTLVPTIRRHGPYVDAWFLRIPTGSSHRLVDDYVCRNGDSCDVSGDTSKGRMAGAYICHYGVNSGHSCGTIRDINYFPTDPTACYRSCRNTFVYVDGSNLKNCNGDSGGPWYIGGIAYGIHNGGSGRDCNSENQAAWFSDIQSVENQLGVDILTRGHVTVQ